MVIPARILCGALLAVTTFRIHPRSAPQAERVPNRADTISLTGTWRAQAVSPEWNGKFTMTLELEQLGDSLHGTYALDYSGRVVTSPVDIYGRLKGRRLQLSDRMDDFLLDARFGASHLDGRLSHGSRERASAVPVTFNRIKDTP